jgi:diaminopimelate epimerase
MVRNTSCYALDAAGNRVAIADWTGRPEEPVGGTRLLPALQRALPGFGIEIACVLTIESGRLRARFWNPDGTPERVCGNALRAIPLLATGGLLSACPGPTDEKWLAVQTDGGEIMTRARWRSRGRAIGAAAFDEAAICAYPLAGGDIVVDPGSPHRIRMTADLDDPAELAVAAALAGDSDPVNVSLLRIERSGLRLRTIERGVGETASCGTGALAAYVFWTRFCAARPERCTLVHFFSGQVLAVHDAAIRGRRFLCLLGAISLAGRASLSP